MPWTTVTSISTGLSFLAFVAVVAASLYRAKLKSDLEELKALPPGDRVSAAGATLQKIGINPKDLSPADQVAFAMKALEGLNSRYRSTVYALLVAVLACVGVAAYSISNEAKVKTGKKEVVYRVCSRPEFGVDRWGTSEETQDNSGWRDSGNTRPGWCAELAARFINARKIGPDHRVETVWTDEDEKKVLGNRSITTSAACG